MVIQKPTSPAITGQQVGLIYCAIADARLSELADRIEAANDPNLSIDLRQTEFELADVADRVDSIQRQRAEEALRNTQAAVAEVLRNIRQALDELLDKAAAVMQSIDHALADRGEHMISTRQRQVDPAA